MASLLEVLWQGSLSRDTINIAICDDFFNGYLKINSINNYLRNGYLDMNICMMRLGTPIEVLATAHRGRQTRTLRCNAVPGLVARMCHGSAGVEILRRAWR